MELLSTLKRAVGKCVPTSTESVAGSGRVLNPLGFNARFNPSLEAKRAFTEWLTNETTLHLTRSAGDRESLKAGVFLALGRSYEAGLSPDETGEAICSSIKAANLGDTDFEFALQQYELLDELLWRSVGQAT